MTVNELYVAALHHPQHRLPDEASPMQVVALHRGRHIVRADGWWALTGLGARMAQVIEPLCLQYPGI